MSAIKQLSDLNKYFIAPKRLKVKWLQDNFYNAFHKAKLNEDDVSLDHIRQVLKAASIDEKKYAGRFVDAPITVYEFLEELAALQQYILSKEKNEELSERHNDVHTLIATINSRQSKQRQKIIFTSLLIFFAVGQLTPFLSHIPDILRVVSMVSNYIPLIMAFYTAGIASLTFYQQLKNGELFREKFIENFFYYSGAALDVSAYAVAITVSVTSPIAGILFVAASMSRAYQEILKYNRLKDTRLEPSVTGEQTLEILQQSLRKESEHSRNLSNLKCDIAAATLMVGVIGVWCFVPGALLFSVAAIVIVLAATKALKTINHKKSKKQLMKAFEELENDFDSSEGFDSSKGLDSSAQQQSEIRAEVNQEVSQDRQQSTRPEVQVIPQGSQGNFNFFRPDRGSDSSHDEQNHLLAKF